MSMAITLIGIILITLVLPGMISRSRIRRRSAGAITGADGSSPGSKVSRTKGLTLLAGGHTGATPPSQRSEQSSSGRITLVR
jgi:hypothetical protein